LALLDVALHSDASGGVPFAQVKELFASAVDSLGTQISATAAALDNAFRFVEDAFGEGQEMLLLITDLSANRYGMAFINDHGCERYFAHNENLLFQERGDDLADRINRLDLSGDPS
ncbi:MAG: ATPase, partial [Sphingobacteriia bacterium]|nr:ATPase [Sphingobacteriia bacterium]